METLPILPSLVSDEEDSSFTKCFDCNVSEECEQALEFFRLYGFVVFRNVFTAEECTKTRDAMWNILEESNPGFKHDDQGTWDNLKAKGSYGLSMRGPSFHPTLVNNRQNPRLANVLNKVVHINSGSTSSNADAVDVIAAAPDLFVSHDRFAVYRATILSAPAAREEETAEAVGCDSRESRSTAQKLEYSTGERNVHLDLNPWWWLEASQDILRGLETLQYALPATLAEPPASGAADTAPADQKLSKKQQRQQEALNEHQDFVRENNHVVRCMGRHVQCVLNFLPNHAEDGGTLVVPHFPSYLPVFCEEYAHLRRPLPWVQFPAEVEALLLQRAHRVTMREGSVLIWDQTMAHGTAPNASRNCRMAQYLKAGPRSLSFPNSPIPARYSDTSSSSKSSKEEEQLERSVTTADGRMVSVRLLRRSQALQRILAHTGALDVITPLGQTLFGLDILSSADQQC